jgi:hypothetical protein
VDETDVKVSGEWRDLYRAVDEFGQAIHVVLSEGVTPKCPAGYSRPRWPSPLDRSR